MQYRLVNARINSGVNAGTSCNILVHIEMGTHWSINSSTKEGREYSRIFSATRPQFDDRPSFGALAFRSGLEYRNSEEG